MTQRVKLLSHVMADKIDILEKLLVEAELNKHVLINRGQKFVQRCVKLLLHV